MLEGVITHLHYFVPLLWESDNLNPHVTMTHLNITYIQYQLLQASVFLFLDRNSRQLCYLSNTLARILSQISTISFTYFVYFILLVHSLDCKPALRVWGSSSLIWLRKSHTWGRWRLGGETRHLTSQDLACVLILKRLPSWTLRSSCWPLKLFVIHHLCWFDLFDLLYNGYVFLEK